MYSSVTDRHTDKQTDASMIAKTRYSITLQFNIDIDIDMLSSVKKKEKRSGLK